MANSRIRRRILFRGFALVALCAGLAACVHVAMKLLDPLNAQRFDSASWATADHEGRAAMARDAIRHLPAGLPETEIEKLLGPARIEETHRLTHSAPRGSVRTYSYHLGGWGLLYYDSTFLWVHVDREGRVIAAVIGGG